MNREGSFTIRAAEAAAFLGSRGFDGPFDAALILGSGLGAVAGALADPVSLPYAEIPHMPRGGVSGHAGTLLCGQLSGKRVLVFQGRAHPYETGDARAMGVPVALIEALGAPILVLTNAAGSLRPEIGPGRLVAIADHINLSGLNPLVGEPSDARFVPMTDAYDPALRRGLAAAADKLGIALSEGVYAWFSGPSFETPAEIRMARLLGADLVGMSTVPETILARFHRIRVAAISIVTNLGAGIDGAAPSHQETKAVAGGAARDLARLLSAFFRNLDDV